MEIGTFRQQHPEYNDMSDPALAQALHKKYYSDMPLEDFSKKFLTAPAPASTQPAGPPPQVPSGMDRFMQGVRDPIDAGAQMLSHAVGDSAFGRGMDKFGQMLGMAPGDVKSIDTGIQEREAKYQAGRQAGAQSLSGLVTGEKPDPGIDWMRMAGNVAPALAMPGIGATTLTGRVGLGALQGAALGSLQPVTHGDYASEKMKQAGLGALTGGIATPIAGKIGDIISPRISKDVKTLMDAGITPTPGQVLGGAWAKTEDKLTSLPLVGDAISAGKRRAINEYNTATYNQALEPIGINIKSGPVGPEGVKAVKETLGDAYEQLLPKLTFKPDAQLAQEVAATTVKAQRSLPLDQARIFTNAVDDLRATPTPNGTLTGRNYQDLMSDLGKDIKSYMGSQMASERKMGMALAEVRDSMKSALERSNPAYAKDLDAINFGYANYARIRGAGSALGKDESGAFTGAQLLNSVKAQDKSVGKGAFATGGALMQDWAQAGKNVLGSKYPDSGTAGRLGFGALMAGGAHSLGYLSPTAIGGGAAASLMYTPAGQKLMAAMLTKRPAWAPGLANYAQRSLAPLPAAALPGLLKASEE